MWRAHWGRSSSMRGVKGFFLSYFRLHKYDGIYLQFLTCILLIIVTVTEGSSFGDEQLSSSLYNSIRKSIRNQSEINQKSIRNQSEINQNECIYSTAKLCWHLPSRKIAIRLISA